MEVPFWCSRAPLVAGMLAGHVSSPLRSAPMSTTPIDRLRSLLFAPAVRPEMLAKLPAAGADGVVIDCEDATPPVAKTEGRAQAR
ncbi:MAG: aldolase/citrate lyase family protein, partial [Myxococcota bacterium]